MMTPALDHAIQLSTCPLCHTPGHALSDRPLAAGGYWHCGRCGHPWTAMRIAKVAAYTEWATAHTAHGA